MYNLKTDLIMQFDLVQQTPIIHFQHKEDGACLRPSEVKPKLDKFIFKELGKGNITNGQEIAAQKCWLISKNNKSLNYKMHISTDEIPIKSNTIDIELKKMHQKSKDSELKKYIDSILTDKSKNLKNIPKSYFGNLCDGKGKEKVDNILSSYKETLFFSNPLKLRIICNSKELREEINKYIKPFFLLNNFGTRQSKGFGSFKIDGNYNVIDIITKYTQNIYEIKFIKNDTHYINDENTQIDNNLKHDKVNLKCLEDVNLVYGFMKGGYNFTKTFDNKTKTMIPSKTPKDYFKGYIFKYFLVKHVDNDKAFIKQELLKLNSEVKEENNSNPKEYKFVRAMLGLPGKIDFSSLNKSILIESRLKEIKRFMSPILFKVVDGRIFMIPQVIPEVMKDCEFKFTAISNDDKGDKNENQIIENIKTVSDFDLIDFLDNFMKDFNDKESKKGGEIGIKCAKHKYLERAKEIYIYKVGDSDEK